jgi:hypothetical protein
MAVPGMKSMRRPFRTALAALVVLTIAGCAPPPLQTDGREHIEIVPLKTYAAVQSRAMMWLAGIRGIDATRAIDCYRIVYPSTDANGRAVRLSGLLALPHGVPPRGLVSFQHGTTSDHAAVPSNLSTEGLAAAILFAGNGYAAIAPDYEGLGVSLQPHPYYVAADTARAVVDMIHAIRHIRGVPRNPPFLIGFSEGGYASLAAQRALEASGEKVLAVAAVAGAYNLRAISIPWTLRGASPQAPIYLALWVRGYATHYGHPLNTAFTAHYATLVPELLDTPHAVDAVMKALPRDPHALFLPVALDAMEGKGRHWLVDALAENEMGDWSARAPIRLYYGADDIDVPPRESIQTAQQMSARGSDARAVNVGAVNHNQSILAAVPLIMRWLAALPMSPTGR